MKKENSDTTSLPGHLFTCIIITGPTAVGKTALAIQLAQHFNTCIISADSRQCFKELSIGVAKPSLQQLQTVKHYFINSHHINQEVNAALFEQYALTTIHEIFQQHKIVIMVGGTGLYIKAFCEGMDDIPAIPENIRTRIVAEYEQKGLDWLQNEVKEKDPAYFEKGETANPQRLMRALEVKLHTGESILYFQKGKKTTRPFNIIKIALDLPRAILYERINNRVDEMMKEGLLNEVKTLIPYQHLNALQTVGYQELFQYLNGNISLAKAVEDIKKNTRHYAKRQLTWFKKDEAFHWFSPLDENGIYSFIAKFVTT
jgi:tRNA dimethylallyltransferase